MFQHLIAAGSFDDTPAPTVSVNVTNRNVTDGAVSITPSAASAIAGIQSGGDGVLRTIVGGPYNPVSGEWLVDGTPAEAQVYCSVISGATPGPAAVSTWLDANTDRDWIVQANRAAVGTTITTCTIRLTYRNKATLETLGFADFTLTAEAIVETGE